MFSLPVYVSVTIFFNVGEKNISQSYNVFTTEHLLSFIHGNLLTSQICFIIINRLHSLYNGHMPYQRVHQKGVDK